MNEGPRMLRLPEWATVSPQKQGIAKYCWVDILLLISYISLHESLQMDALPVIWCSWEAMSMRAENMAKNEINFKKSTDPFRSSQSSNKSRRSPLICLYWCFCVPPYSLILGWQKWWDNTTEPPVVCLTQSHVTLQTFCRNHLFLGSGRKMLKPLWCLQRRCSKWTRSL